MKPRIKTALLGAFLAAIAVPTSAISAELLDNRWYVAPAVTYTFFDDESIDDEIGGQFAVGRAVSDWLNLELIGFGTKADLQNSAAEFTQYGLGIEGLLFPWRDKFPVFGIIGVAGGVTDIDDTGTALDDDYDTGFLDAGLGFLFPITQGGTSIRGEYRSRSSFIEDLENIRDDVITLGLHIPFGKKPVAPPPPPPPAPPPPPPPPPPPVKTCDKVSFDGSDVWFDFDKAALRAESQGTLDETAAMLNKYPSIELVLLMGHTDSTGPDEYNRGLSQRRVDSVKAYMVSKGVAESRMRSKGYGESSPVASNKTKEGRQKNRRVEMMILKITGDDVCKPSEGICVPPAAGDSVDEAGCANL